MWVQHHFLAKFSGVAAALALVLACGETTGDIAAPDARDGDANGTVGEPSSPDGKDGSTSTPEETKPTETSPAFCDVTRTYFEACGNESDLNCGAAGFDAWCSANDALNSEAFRQAETKCLTTKNCDGRLRRDCDYSFYASVKPTVAQKSLVAAYCTTCFPDDVASCTKRSTVYDKQAGIEAVPDIFVAAWELADPLVAEIEAACTGAALGVDEKEPLKCPKAFAACAGNLFLDRVPDCSK